MRFVLSIPFFLDPVFLNSQCLLSNTHCACLSYRQLGCDNFSAGFSWLVVAQLWHASVQKKSDSSAVRSNKVEPRENVGLREQADRCGGPGTSSSGGATRAAIDAGGQYHRGAQSGQHTQVVETQQFGEEFAPQEL